MPQTLIAPLSFKTLKLTYRVTKGFVINRFKGTAIKGWLFDAALRKTKHYKLHESFKAGLPTLSKYTPPEYFALKYPFDNTQLYRTGDYLSFEITLIGDGIALYPEWLQWFATMDNLEIGYAGQPGQLRLQNIDIDATLTGQALLDSLPPKANKLNLNFLSPTELKMKDKAWLTPELPFHLVATSAMERLRLLNFYYTPAHITNEEMNTTIDLEDACSRIKIMNTDLAADDSLYRTKTDKEKKQHHIPGLVGNITYTCPLDEWLPLIFAAEKVNLGHLSTWGKGQLIVDAS
jgi:hypothetical protein